MTWLVLGILLLVVVLAAAIVFRGRVASIVSVVSGITFLVLVVVALTALFAPGIYETLAEITLENIGVLAQIRSMDDQFALNTVANITQEILSNDALRRALDMFGGAPSLDGLVKSDQSPTRLIEQNLYPSLVSMVAAIYRIGAVILSVSGMIAAVALWYASSVLGEARRLSKSYAALEARVEQLEAAQR